MPSHQICNEHPGSERGREPLLWLMIQTNHLYTVQCTGNSSSEGELASADPFRSLCRQGHLEPGCPSRLEVAPPLEDPPARGEFSLGVPDVEGIEQADQEI